jgi:hypothetical protein
MKPLMMLIGATVVLLAFIQAQSLAQEKYIPTADEEIYGTWTNKDHFPQKVVTGPDGYKAYNFMSDSAPIEEGTVTIDSKWTDQDGNVWYKTFGTVTYGTYKGSTYQELHKLSKSGTVSETVDAFGDFDPNKYPTRINPMAETYRIYYRTEK